MELTRLIFSLGLELGLLVRPYYDIVQGQLNVTPENWLGGPQRVDVYCILYTTHTCNIDNYCSCSVGFKWAPALMSFFMS